MSVFLILIGLPRNSQCRLQSPQAALVCVQSPNFNSLRTLVWLTDKEHDEGHWRKRARIEKGAENLSTKHWASPKPSQLSNCWFLSWKSLLSSPSACLLFYVLLVTNKWNQNCLSEMHLHCWREALHCVSSGEKGWNLGHSPGVLGLTSGNWQLKCLVDLQFLCFCSLDDDFCILFHSTGDNWVEAEFLQLPQ